MARKFRGRLITAMAAQSIPNPGAILVSQQLGFRLCQPFLCLHLSYTFSSSSLLKKSIYFYYTYIYLYIFGSSRLLFVLLCIKILKKKKKKGSSTCSTRRTARNHGPGFYWLQSRPHLVHTPTYLISLEEASMQTSKQKHDHELVVSLIYA